MSLPELRQTAVRTFVESLRAAEPGPALTRAISFRDGILSIKGEKYDLTAFDFLCAIAIGKAAYPMAVALERVLNSHLSAGVLSGPHPSSASVHVEPNKQRNISETWAGYVRSRIPFTATRLSAKWRIFSGGHPIPNEESLKAATACFELLDKANRKKALVIFLVSGGGSAMLEWPRSQSMTLEDLRVTNRLLVDCGAPIREVNSVRGAVSAIKCGRLADRAPNAEQITLIVSDVNSGEEWLVASGPSLSPRELPSALDVIESQGLSDRLPESVRKAVEENSRAEAHCSRHANFHVLLSNQDALKAAAEYTSARGFLTEIDFELAEQPIDVGTKMLCTKLLQGYTKTKGKAGYCLISGGEFGCTVRGRGLGGRNSETALRIVLVMAKLSPHPRHFVALSAGTDGIDGNSPAAGALCDDTTLARAHSTGLSLQASLESSDTYSFFQQLNDRIVTGQTSTNVRDIRIMIAV